RPTAARSPAHPLVHLAAPGRRHGGTAGSTDCPTRPLTSPPRPPFSRSSSFPPLLISNWGWDSMIVPGSRKAAALHGPLLTAAPAGRRPHTAHPPPGLP